MITRLLASFALVFTFSTVNAQDSEEDFSLQTLSTNLEQPMAMEVDPDGNIFIVGRCGSFYVWSSNTEAVEETSSLDVRCDLELGLIGITLDPDYIANRWVYLQYNPDGESSQRVSRFVMNPDNSLDMGSEIVMLEFDVQTEQCCHQGGDLEFGPDGNLFISVGDNTNPFRSDGFTPIDERDGRSDFDAQGTSGNTNDLRGKILRITPNDDGSYSIPSGNLFEGDSEHRAEIYVMGNRNPFRMAIDEETGNLFWGEIGPDANSPDSDRGPTGYDEINRTSSPGNFGWPYVSGPNEPYTDYNFDTSQSGAQFDPNGPENDSPNNTGASVLPPSEPAWVLYPHAAMMAGLVYHYDNSLNTAGSDRRLPPSFDDRLIFWNFNNGVIYTIESDSDGGDDSNVTRFFDDLTRNRSLIDMTLDNDDRMIVLGYDRDFNGELHRVEFGGDQGSVANQGPDVVADVSPSMGSLPLTVDFSAAGTTDPDGDDLTYEWDFTADGNVDENGIETSHVYTDAGQFTAQLRVTDSEGNTVVRNFSILAGISAPVVNLTNPEHGSFFEFGDVIDWQVSVEDSSLDGGANCADIDVELVLGHVTGSTEHEHGIVADAGCSGSFDTGAVSGHDGESIFLGVTASYTNSDGITANDDAELWPRFREAEHWTEQSGVVAEETTDIGGGFSAAYIENGDWLMFRDTNLINVNQIDMRVASETLGGTIEARIGGVSGEVIGTLDVETTGGWQVWETRTMVIDPAAQNLGVNDLFFTFSGGGGYLFNVNWFDFDGDGPTSPGPVDDPILPVEPGPGESLQRIEAENFSAQSGIQTESTTDVGGGLNVGYINDGDSVDYELTVPASGTYDIAFRVASAENGGTVTLTQDGVELASFDSPVTGDWQNWVTVDTTANLSEGTNTYSLEFSGPGRYLMNINWFDISGGSAELVGLEGGDLDQ